MTFDLSSVCIGVTFAQLSFKGNVPGIVYADTLAIIPNPPTPKDFGYTTLSPKKLSKAGVAYSGFLRPGEALVGKGEAERREREIKSLTHNQLLRDIGKQCGHYLGKVRPQIVAIEKNKSFNGILTTKLLAEIAGGIYFYCGANNIQLYDWDESVIRAKIRRDISDFSREGDSGAIALDTKWEIHCRLRSYFSQMFPGILDFSKMTMDESDSLAVFYYLYTQVIMGGKHNVELGR